MTLLHVDCAVAQIFIKFGQKHPTSGIDTILLDNFMEMWEQLEAADEQEQ
jgi:hypothetical protein